MLITMTYMMYFFIAESTVDPEHQWTIGYVTMFLLAFVFFVNWIALIYMTVCRLCFFYKVKKARQAFLKARFRRKAMYKKVGKLMVEVDGTYTRRVRTDAKLRKSQENDQLNLARELSQVIEEVFEEGSILIIKRTGAAELIDDDDSFCVIKVKETKASKNLNNESARDVPPTVLIPGISETVLIIEEEIAHENHPQ